MALMEFELIARYFSPLMPEGVGGDDCATLAIPAGAELAVSTDTLVEGVHFPAGCDPEKLAWRAIGSCASDLAAMGAAPLGYTLALTLPEAEPEWLAGLSRGLAAAGTSAGIALLGGDTTRGALSLTLTVLGAVPAAAALRRAGGRSGDDIWVSGYLGAAAAALHCLDQADPPAPLLDHYWKPRPRLRLGCELRSLATAAIDISDGLAADLGHICAASRCGALVDPATLPLHPDAVALLGDAQARVLALSGGDDYELCFTAPAAAAGAIAAAGRAAGVAVQRIGELTEGGGIRSTSGEPLIAAGAQGYQHFGGPAC